SHLQRQVSLAWRVQDIIVKLVLLVPKTDPAAADIVHRRGDAEKMFEKLCGDIFIDMVFARELDRDPHQVKGKHSHPTGTVALLEMTSIEETGVAVEHADVVEPEKSALENVVVFGVLAIHPPGKGDEHIVENSFEKRAVALAGSCRLDLQSAQRRPAPRRR